MKFVLAILFAAISTCAQAAGDARTYAILSLLGDELLVVSAEMTTGSSLDRNPRTRVKLDTPALDHAALLAGESAFKEASLDARPVLLLVRDPATYAAQVSFLDEDSIAGHLLPVLAPALKGSGATHLVLFTKQRHDAAIRLDNSTIGSGKLEGLGFYVDRVTPLISTTNGDNYKGFLAPFAYFRISIIDIASGKVLAEKSVRASWVYGTHTAIHPWDELTPEKKVAALRSMLRGEIEKSLSPMLEAIR